jgi:hypothetical protein
LGNYFVTFLGKMLDVCFLSMLWISPDVKNGIKSADKKGIKKMRKSEEKVAFGKLTKYIGKVFTYMNQVEDWTVTEIAEKIQQPLNRVSEVKNYSKHQRPINEQFLASCIGGGIITMEEILAKAGLNEDEKGYVGNIVSFYKNKDLRMAYIAAEKEGIDVLSLIQKAREDKKK